MTQYVIGLIVLLFALGCFVFVTFTYAMAFGLRGWLGHRRRVRASARELLASLLLVPLWPFWWLVGESYKVKLEGKGRATERKNPVLLLHGFAMNRTQWVWLGRRLAELDVGPVYGRTYFSPRSIAASARHLQRMVEDICARENAERVDIVAHSLGGLVARYYIERMDGARHVGRLITIGSPHRGTKLGRLGFVPAARELITGLPFEHRPEGVHYVGIWSPDDAVVQPADSASVATWGRDYVFEGESHLSLLISPAVLDRLATELRA